MPLWGSKYKNFSIKEVYNYLSMPTNPLVDGNLKQFNLVWRWQGSQRLRVFLWRLVHGRLMTNELKRYRHMDDSNICPRCSFTKNIWCIQFEIEMCSKGFLVELCWSTKLGNFLSLGLHDWINFNLIDKSLKGPVGFFGTVIDLLWRDKNDLVFHHKSNMALV